MCTSKLPERSTRPTRGAPRELRPYQRDAANAVLGLWAAQTTAKRTNPLVVLPTGSGKSTVIAHLATTARAMGLRVLMLAHRRELLDQMAASVQAVDPTGDEVGIVQAERDNPHTSIVAASFQTLVANPTRLDDLGHRDVILVDEVHHSAAETYMGVLDTLGVKNATRDGTQIFSCGFTATAARSDGGLDQLWDVVAYEKSLKWAIDQGFLVNPRGLTVVLPGLNLEKITVRAGDYAPGELEDVMEASTQSTVMAILTHASDKKLIVFAAGVDHCEALAASLTAAGIVASAVTGATTSDEREEIYAAYRAGVVQALITVQVLTEGADFPMCDCVVMARPTRSQTLYSQMVGRALRLWEGKTEALVLDLAGSTRDMSLVTITDLHGETPTRRVAPDSQEDPGQEEPEKPKRRQRIGVVRVEDFDLMAQSPANWLTTHKGIKFLDAKGVVILLWPPKPTPETPATIGLKFYGGQRGESGWYQKFDTAREAVEVAEELAKELGEFPNAHASWRKKSMPSDAQIRYAKILGITRAEDKTRARLADDITVEKISAMIDPYFAKP